MEHNFNVSEFAPWHEHFQLYHIFSLAKLNVDAILVKACFSKKKTTSNQIPSESYQR